MKSAIDVLDAFENIRRAQRAGVYAPHKPLLVLAALARVQRGEPRLVEFTALEGTLRKLLAEFGSGSAVNTPHYPFWHLATDGSGALWELSPREFSDRPRAATPNLRDFRDHRVRGGFPLELDDALRCTPGLLEAVASRVLDAYFPATLHADIAATVGLDLSGPMQVKEGTPLSSPTSNEVRPRRDPGFRDRVLRAYEYRCCVCGFDLRIGHIPAGLEAAHIQWHQFGGPDIEPNGLSLCALHHKLFDLGAFTITPGEFRVVFSEHAISGERGMSGELRHHGRVIHIPQRAEFYPGPDYLRWNAQGPFKRPARPVPDAMPRAEH